MTGFSILDLILGLVFIFFLLSIISSAVVEAILTRRNIRSKVLTKWLFTIFDKPFLQPDNKRVRLGQAISDHCLTTALAGEGRATAFIDSKNFTSALIEKLSYDPAKPDKVISNLDDLVSVMKGARALDGTTLLSTELTRTFLLFASEAALLAPPSLVRPEAAAAATTALPVGAPPAAPKNSLQIFREKVENWFDSNMDRVTGTMKKKYTRPLTFWVSVVVVLLLNVDTLQIANYLYNHKEEAKQFADRATVTAQYIEQMSRDSTDTAKTKVIAAAIDSLQKVVPKDMPIGWETDHYTKAGDYVKAAKGHAFGWLATIMAITLGAPFWFDLLNKIANIRGTGLKPPSSTDAGRKVTDTSP